MPSDDVPVGQSGPLIRSIRRRFGLSQVDLGRLLGASERSVWHAENHGGTLPLHARPWFRELVRRRHDPVANLGSILGTGGIVEAWRVLLSEQQCEMLDA